MIAEWKEALLPLSNTEMKRIKQETKMQIVLPFFLYTGLFSQPKLKKTLEVWKNIPMFYSDSQKRSRDWRRGWVMVLHKLTF